MYAYLVGGVWIISHCWGWGIGVGAAAGVVEREKRRPGNEDAEVLSLHGRRAQRHSQSYSITNKQGTITNVS